MTRAQVAAGHEIARWRIDETSPVLATAVHDGHELRPEIREVIALDPADRLREEDPYTGRFAALTPSFAIVLRSRFEVDLNRSRELAVYSKPEDAWGLTVWPEPLPKATVERSLESYDAFYARLHRVLDALTTRHGRVVVLDLHSYNHRREGPSAPAADPAANPEINFGTGSVDRARWGPFVDRFMEHLADHGDGFDVRENVRFTGGHLSAWINSTFGDACCSIAIEFKKTFMDEHTGELYEDRFARVADAFVSSLGMIEEELAGSRATG